MTDRPRVLVVDDEPAQIMSLHALLGDDYEILMATDGASALALSRDLAPDLVLLDLNLPGMSGLEICEALKAGVDTGDIPVVFLTGSDDPETETQGLDAGAADFVSKPYEPTVICARVRRQLALKARADEVRALALVDALTELPNRRAFELQIDREWRACRRSQIPLGVMMCDLDGFKAYNDTLGHLMGDDALRAVAQVLRASLRRPRDFIARFGGEEFVCVIPESDPEQTLRVAEHLCQSVAAAQIPHPKSATGAPFLTLSAGAAATVPAPSDTWDHWVRRADDVLYEAKEAGRNRARVWSDA